MSDLVTWSSINAEIENDSATVREIVTQAHPDAIVADSSYAWLLKR
jgi:hypothetical protein